MLRKVSTSAPGKIILCGEHAVVYGKEAIACSLNLRANCCIEMLQELKFEIKVTELDLQKSWSIAEVYQLYDAKKIDPLIPEIHEENENLRALLESEQDKLRKLSLHIIIMLYVCIGSSFHDRNTGIRITLSSELPIGGGLGSSASFAVSISSCLLILFGIIDNNQDAWKDKDYKLINDWAYKAETVIHGTPSGIDNSIATYGHCLSFKCGSINQLTDLSRMHLDVLVVNTRVRRSTKDVVAGVRVRMEKFTELYNSLFHSIDCVTKEFKQILLEISRGSNNARVYHNLKDLIIINEHLLESVGVGHESISKVISTCSQYGLGSKLTGAGAGGCVFVLLPPGYAEEKIACVEKELKLLQFDCWRTVLGGDGILLHSVS